MSEEEEKRGRGRPRLTTSGRLVRYIRTANKKNYKHTFEVPSLWFNYLSTNCERYKFELDTKNKRIIISVPTFEEIDKEFERRAASRREIASAKEGESNI